MKKIIGLSLMALICICISAQGQKNDDGLAGKNNSSTFSGEAKDHLPEFEGGIKALAIYMRANVHYPKDAINEKKHGTVEVEFTVRKNGKLTKAKVVDSVCPSLDKEALRMVKSMPRWKPGRLNGAIVGMTYTLPVKFKIDNTDSLVNAVEYISAEEVRADSNKIFISVENVPEFPGGTKALTRFLSENIVYPDQARESDVQGRVVLWFVVSKNGEIIKAKVKKDIGYGCGTESLRVVNSMPQWKPGTVYGVPVDVAYVLPVSYKLQD